MEESIKRQHKPLERRARRFSWPARRFFTQSTRRRQWPSFAGLKQEISARDDPKGKRNKISRQDAKAQRKEGKTIEYYGRPRTGPPNDGLIAPVGIVSKNGWIVSHSPLSSFAPLRLGVRFSPFTLCARPHLYAKRCGQVSARKKNAPPGH